MCRNAHTQSLVIEMAKQDTPEVYAVYEQESTPNLVGLVKVYEGVRAVLFDVFTYGDIESFKSIPVWGNPSNRTIASWFGLTHMYRVVAC